jgi:hypothetical protein
MWGGWVVQTAIEDRLKEVGEGEKMKTAKENSEWKCVEVGIGVRQPSMLSQLLARYITDMISVNERTVLLDFDFFNVFFAIEDTVRN